jgi:hypothetical protein
MLSDQEMRERMANGWRMGKPFTICGNGSTLEATANIRRWLPDLVKRYGIESVVDAGAGDMAWLPYMKWDVAYQPFDLIPRHPDVAQIDITTELLPRADAILCRMVLNHLQERLDQTVDLLKAGGSRYLIATQFDAGTNRTRQFQRLDLRPYFGEPLESVQDGREEGCLLSLFELSA